MERVITVKGIGKINVKPDQIILSIQIKAQDKSYEKTLQIANEQMDNLRNAVVSCGIEKNDLKTKNFSIDTNYDSIRDKNDNYRRVFKGFVCDQHLNLKLPLDMILLAAVLSALSDSHANPEFSIRFTLADSNQISEDLLIDATKNAFQKAKILTKAADATLGDLLNINYNWGEIDIYSQTESRLNQYKMVDFGFDSSAVDIVPEDIQVSDTVSFVWEIK